MSFYFYLFYPDKHKDSSKFLIGVVFEFFYYLEILYFYFLSFFLKFGSDSFKLLWVNFFLCKWSKKDVNIFYNVSNESNI